MTKAVIANSGSGELTVPTDKNSPLVIKNENEGVTVPLPYPVAAGEKIKVTIEGQDNDSTGFRLYTVNAPLSIGATSDVYADSQHARSSSAISVTEAELTVNPASTGTYLCIRKPQIGSGTISSTITKVTVMYVPTEEE